MIGDSREGPAAAKEVRDTDLVELEEVIEPDLCMILYIDMYVCMFVCQCMHVCMQDPQVIYVCMYVCITVMWYVFK